jgi:hypothetical protein
MPEYNLQNDYLKLDGKKVRRSDGKISFIFGTNILTKQVRVKCGTMNQSRKSWIDFNDLEVLD